MNLKTALLLSTSEYLTEEMQEVLITTGDEAVLRNLASNRFLAPRLKYKFVNDDKLINHMLSHPQSDLIFLKKALLSCQSEQTMLKFTNQELLNSDLISILAEKATPIVAYYLAGHSSVDTKTKIKLFDKYFEIMGEINQYSLRDFNEKFGEDPLLWRHILSKIGFNQAVVARGALNLIAKGELDADYLVSYIERVGKEIEDKSENNKNWFRVQGESRKLEEIEGLALALTSLTNLEVNSLKKLAGLSFLTKSKTRAIESLEKGLVLRAFEVRERYKALRAYGEGLRVELTKTGSGLGEEEINSLKILLDSNYDFTIPSFEICFLLLIYRDSIDNKMLKEGFDTIRGLPSRDMVNLLLEMNLVEELVCLVKYLSTIIVSDVELDSYVLRRLSSEGILDYNNKEYIKKYSSEIVENFTPLYQITVEPNLLGRVISRLEELGSSEKEIALTLLPEWSGNLTDLIETAQRLNLKTPEGPRSNF